MNTKGGFVYILSNKNNTALYVGVTSNLTGRIWEHKNNVFINSFTSRYNINKLVYYEWLPSIEEAIEREQQLKAGSRKKKIDLIELENPEW